MFEYRLVVTIGDTNMEQNVYWTRYCEWFGTARELFFLNLFPPEVNVVEFLTSKNLAIITCDVDMKFMKSAYFTDKIVVKISVADVKHYSLKVIGQITKETTGEILATGKQTLTFADAQTKKLIKIPEELRQAVSSFV